MSNPCEWCVKTSEQIDSIEYELEEAEKRVAYSIEDHINKEWGGNQAAFARAQGVQPPQVTQWIEKDFIVVDNALYSHRRDLTTNTQ